LSERADGDGNESSNTELDEFDFNVLGCAAGKMFWPERTQSEDEVRGLAFKVPLAAGNCFDRESAALALGTHAGARKLAL
jgi:hypothetical protein